MRSALLITIGLILAPAGVLAKPRVALVTFEGDPGGAAQDVVTEIIGDEVMFVGPKQVNRTAWSCARRRGSERDERGPPCHPPGS